MDNKNRMNDRKTDILPNFLVIGAFKSGTNSLYHYLKPHPQIFMCPANEPSFFAFEGKKISGGRWAENIITNLEDYKKLFVDAKSKIAVGEVSPTYLVSVEAPARIKHHLPIVKLIAILRHPVDRAYSEWQMEFRQGHEKKGFASAIRDTKIASDGSIRTRFLYGSMYYRLLRNYYDQFERSQIRVLLFDNLTAKRSELLRNTYSFLNVEPSFIPATLDLRFNEGGGVPRGKTAELLIQKILPHLSNIKLWFPPAIRDNLVQRAYRARKQLLTKPPELEPELRKELILFFKDDILRLQDLIQEDLTNWLS